jgi:hypothetical protein
LNTVQGAAPAVAVTPPLSAPAPFSLTATHFGAALLFLVLGAAGLVWVAPSLAAGRYLLPQVVAVTHLFTLGWITTSMLGAFYQLYPVVLGTPMRWYALGHASLALYAPGLLLFVGGMLAGATLVMLAGAALFSAGLLLFLVNAVASLLRAPSRDLTWVALAAAFTFLLVTIVLGASLAGNLRWFYLGMNRLTALGVHMHVALGGWILLVVIAVGRKLLPMFLLSHDSEDRPGRVAAVLVMAGAGTLTLFHHAAGGAVSRFAGVLLAAGAVAFLAQVALYLRHSHRPGLDAGLRLAAAGMAFLAVSVALGAWALAGNFAVPRLNTAYGTAVVLGAFSLFVAGHYYKILPFLVWNHRYAHTVGRGRRVPKVADLYDMRTASAAAMLLISGTAVLVMAVLAGWPAAARGAAVVVAAGVAIEALQMMALFRRGSP